MNRDGSSTIEISHRTILFTVIVLVGLWLLIQIRDILFLLFISFIVMSATRPIVDLLGRIKIPRVVSILAIYAIVFGIIGSALIGSVPTLVSQTTRLAVELPKVTEKLLPYWRFDDQWVSQQIAPIGENVVKLTVSLFSNIITVMTVLVFTFYFLLERHHTEALLANFMGEDASHRIIQILKAVEARLGGWVLGELSLMVFIGLLVYGGLSLLHIDYALPLAVLAGLLEIVPVVGPIISAVPAVLVGLTVSPLLALSVVALYFIIQQVENTLVVPLVMQKSVGINPLVTIVSLLIGGKLAGIMGMVLAVPVVLVIQEVIREFLNPSSKEVR